MTQSVSKTDLFSLLNLPNDDSVIISEIQDEENVLYIHLSRDPQPIHCPHDGYKMHSKGIYCRKVKHPIRHDGTEIILIVHQRKWRCPHCGRCINESFPFLEKYKQSSTLTPLLVLNEMKNLDRSTVSVARQFGLSDTQVHDLFTGYVDLKRLPLTPYISVDEVYLDISDREKYAFVIMDFQSGQIIDIVHNRWSNTLENYFLNIPYEERKIVKAVISDAYEPYLEMPDRFFPNACSILDSFHVIKYLINLLNNHLVQLLKRYKEKNLKELLKKNHDLNLDMATIKTSREMILLHDYKWVLLKNQGDINYSTRYYYHRRLGMNVDTYRIESLFFELDPSLKPMRDLKEEYIRFNNTKFHDEESASQQLDALIRKFKYCEFSVFQKFADYLQMHRAQIIRSFTYIEVSRKDRGEVRKYYARLSNGPMESFNRKPKDYKRSARGTSNFDYTRNRILWATRTNPPIRGIKKDNKEIHQYRKKPRGAYKK